MQVNKNMADESDSQSLVWIVALNEKQKGQFHKLLDKPKNVSHKTGYQHIDYVLAKLDKRRKLPNWLVDIGRPIVDHALRINDSLIILYPYGFYHDQFLDLAKKAISNKFNIQVNPTLRGEAPCLRLILWKDPSNYVPIKNR